MQQGGDHNAGVREFLTGLLRHLPHFLSSILSEAVQVIRSCVDHQVLRAPKDLFNSFIALPGLWCCRISTALFFFYQEKACLCLGISHLSQPAGPLVELVLLAKWREAGMGRRGGHIDPNIDNIGIDTSMKRSTNLLQFLFYTFSKSLIFLHRVCVSIASLLVLMRSAPSAHSGSLRQGRGLGRWQGESVSIQLSLCGLLRIDLSGDGLSW